MLLKDYYPKFLTDSPTFKAYLDTAQMEHNKIENGISDILAQLFVTTATWGLSSWEKMLGIKTDEAKAIEYRRTVILAKLQGVGTTTKQAIKDIALAFQNGEIDVIENPADASFKIKFISVKGVPPNLQDFLNMIEEIKPAHLGFSYEFSYLAWDEWERANKTWTEFEALNMTWDQFEVWKP